MSKSLTYHKKYRGKIQMCAKVKVNSQEDLAIYYSPGVADPALEIAKDRTKTNLYTNRGNTIAIISDGTAVLGLGNIGPEASLPIMEGKALLFKEFGHIDAIPIILKSTNTQTIIQTIENISPSFAGINLEDIAAPRCVLIERALQAKLKIPVFHDDQHGTSIVVLAAIINACRLKNKKIHDLKVLLIGTGAAGSSIARLIKKAGVKTIHAFNQDGAVNNQKTHNFVVQELLDEKIISEFKTEDLTLAFDDKDVVIGVSKGNIINEQMIRKMNHDPWVFSLANPVPEIMPEKARNAGASIVGTGRSDYPNQINNLLAFPGLFRGLLDHHVANINLDIMWDVANAIAYYIKQDQLKEDYILPSNLDKNIPQIIARKLKKYSQTKT